VKLSSTAVVSLCALALLAPAAPVVAYSEPSVGTPEQIAWVRHAARRFVVAELSANGAEACAVMTAARRVTVQGLTCEQRWSARLRRMLRGRGVRARLLAEQRAVASALVVVRGDAASIELPGALIRFVWTENCWMLAA
jgi:hypothetical protein